MRYIFFSALLAAGALFFGLRLQPSHAFETLVIPTEHPRLLFSTPGSLDRARQWWAQNPHTPRGDDYFHSTMMNFSVNAPMSPRRSTTHTVR